MPRLLAFLFLLSTLPGPAFSEELIRVAGRLRVAIDTTYAYPGGLLLVRLVSPSRVNGVVYGILDGRRCPFFPSPKGLRALVPVPVTFPSGPSTLGIEVRASTGRQRVATTIEIRPRSFPARSEDVPEAKRALLDLRSGVRDGRLLLQSLRTITPLQVWRKEFEPPVSARPESTFGAPEAFAGPPVLSRTDAIHGEYHRGVDYLVPVGTPVHAPAAGIVALSGPLTLTGDTVVLDHGQGVMSVFYHLATIQARPGEEVYAGQRIGTSGESGIAARPHVHWGVYVHTVAVDPRIMEKLDY